MTNEIRWASSPRFLSLLWLTSKWALASLPGVILVVAVGSLTKATVDHGLAILDRGGIPLSSEGKKWIGSAELKGFARRPDLLDVRYDAPTARTHLAQATYADQSRPSAGSIQALEGYATTSHRSGEVTLAIGTIGHADNTSNGTLRWARGIQGGAGNSGSGTIEHAAQLFAGGFNTESGHIENAYGLYTSLQKTGQKNFAIYSQMPTADLGFIDAGIEGASGAGWIRVSIDGRVSYIKTSDRP